jgi:DNA polymerase III delta prime subunit
VPHTFLSAGSVRTDRLAHSRAFLAAAAAPAEGIAELTTSLVQQLQQGSGVRGLLLHGVGGIGKTTLAAHVARSLQPSGAAAAAGRFAGGVCCVSIQAGAADNAIARDQVWLLECRTHAEVTCVSCTSTCGSFCIRSDTGLDLNE